MFWIYENWVHKYARVHHANCAYCNDGAGNHDASESHAGQWMGPFERFGDAVTASKYGATPCGHCVPSE